MNKFYKKFELKAIYITVLLLLITVSVFTYLIFNEQGGKTIEVDGNGGYSLRYNATDYQKEVFSELEALINSDNSTEKDIAGSVVKNFIADFYTWTNKQGSHDVGGLGFVYGPSILNIQQQAKAYFYRDLTYYQTKYGSENLLQVDSVNIKYVDPETPYILNDIEYTSYYVGAEWTYKPNDVFSPAEYQTKGYFSVLIRDGKYEIYRYFLE